MTIKIKLASGDWKSGCTIIVDGYKSIRISSPDLTSISCLKCGEKNNVSKMNHHVGHKVIQSVLETNTFGVYTHSIEDETTGDEETISFEELKRGIIISDSISL